MCLFSVHIIDSIQDRQWLKKKKRERRSDEDRCQRNFQKEQTIFLKSNVSLHIEGWGGSNNSCCNDTKHFKSCGWLNISPVPLVLLVLLLPCDSSMDVQGDYDPCDASGFIRINAVRLASLRPVRSSLLIKLFLNSRVFSSSPQAERTPPPAGFVQHKKLNWKPQTCRITIDHQDIDNITAFQTVLSWVNQACVLPIQF